jgi:predicted P-loop ATPase
MKVSLFLPMQGRNGEMIPGVKPLSQINYSDYFEYIKNGEWEKEVLNIRAKRASKTSAPGVTPSGTFSRRAAKSIIQHSGVIALDFDAKDNVSFPADQVACDPYCWALHKSISGNGWVLYVKIEPERHLEAYLALEKHFANEYGAIADPSGKDVGRFRFVSHDPDLLYNKDAAVWKKYLPKRNIMPQGKTYVHSESDIEHIINQVRARGIDLTSDYHDWLKIGMAIASKYSESGREYFHQISSVSIKYDQQDCDKKYTNFVKTSNGSVSIASLFWLAQLAGVEIKTSRTKHIERVVKMQRRVVGSSGGHADSLAAGEAAKKILEEIDGIDGEDVDSVIGQVMEMPVSDLTLDKGDDLIANTKEFLRSYNLKLNLVTRHIETNGNEITDRDYNSMYIKALELLTPPNSKGQKVSKELLISLIESDNTVEYHPFKDWFKEHANLDPSGVIEELFDCVKVQDFNVNGSVLSGREYLQKYGKKWLLSCIASWHGTYSVMMLVFTGQQNLGKTKFFRGLLPNGLQKYYAESSLDEGKDSEILMCKKAIICDDEFEGMNKGDYKRLKALISKQMFTVRRPYGRVAEDLPRYAVLCGTGNEEEIINDPTGNRRIIPVPVLDIDWERYALIDKDALWMELYNEWKTIGDDWMMSRADVKVLNQLTVKNEQTSIEEEMIQKYFSPPSEGGFTEFLTNTEIRDYIESNTAKIKISTKLLGLYLKKLGYERMPKKVNGSVKRGYNVVKVQN